MGLAGFAMALQQGEAILGIPRGGGRIVAVASVTMSRTGRNYGGMTGVQYGTSKVGMLCLTRQMAVEMGPYGITVNAVAPV